jgi:hypothetical protein
MPLFINFKYRNRTKTQFDHGKYLVFGDIAHRSNGNKARWGAGGLAAGEIPVRKALKILCCVSQARRDTTGRLMGMEGSGTHPGRRRNGSADT